MSARRTSSDVAALPWAGPVRRYDIVKEFVIALVVMAVLSVGLAVAFGGYVIALMTAAYGLGSGRGR